MNNSWLQSLNEQQRQAVLKTDGPLLILAGAGSGKTTVLVSRTGYILSQSLAKPQEVLVLTFTNKAAKELKERVSHKLGADSKKVWAGTFHGWGLEFLKKNYKLAGLPQRFGLLDATDARSLIKDLLKERQHHAKASFDVELLQSILSNQRAGKSVSPKIDESYLDMADWLLPAYISKMHSLGLIDFDGLILKPIELLKENPDLAASYKQRYKYIMVDEFQDTNKTQMDLVMSICNSQQNLAVVGDDDQSIYGWRGAEIQNILGFPKLFKNCEVVRLETNYRSTPQILEMANSIINRNDERHKKQLVPNPSANSGPLPEVFIYDNEEMECEEVNHLILDYHKKGIPFKDIAILFRSNSQGTLLEGYLKRNNIAYDMTGGPALIDRKEVRDVLAYIRTAISPNDIALRRILNVPSRGIGDTSIHKLIDFQKAHELSFYASIRKWSQTEIPEKTGGEINKFLDLINDFKSQLLNSPYRYEQLLPKFFANIGYQEYVQKSYKDKATAQRKWQLVEILGRILDSFVERSGKNEKTIREFIETLELRDSDDDKEEQSDKVQLLTLHASKGLEYPIVILMGVDEGLLPHENLGHNIAEERRLFYVGVTRAKNELLLTRSRKRKRYGKWRDISPSRFLCEVPDSLITTHDSGYRPLSDNQRSSLLENLYKKLDKDIKARQEV